MRRIVSLVLATWMAGPSINLVASASSVNTQTSMTVENQRQSLTQRLPPQRPPPQRPPPQRPPPQRPPPQRPPPQRPPPYRPPPPRPPIHQQETRQFNQLFGTGDVIDLRLALGLDRWRYGGYAVDYVVVRVRNPDPRSQELTLLINNYMEDRLRPSSWDNTFVIRGWKELDYHIRTLDLQVTGWVEIDSITVYMTLNR